VRPVHLITGFPTVSKELNVRYLDETQTQVYDVEGGVGWLLMRDGFQ
jgi:hypothetical protein